MIIKTFTEESSAAALKRVRTEMGGDAIVLKTRRVVMSDNAPMFEVTACLEKASVARASDLLKGDKTGRPAPVKPETRPEPESKPPMEAKSEETPRQSVTELPTISLKADTPSEEDGDALDQRINAIDRKLNQLINLGIKPDGISRLEMFQEVHRQLKEADLPDDYLEMFMSTLVENYDGSTDIMTYAHERLASQLKTTVDDTIEFRPGDRVTFVGPAGSGKSSAMGKLAAWLTAVQRQKVRLLSLDDHKLAAFDEICSYADILGLEVIPPPAAQEESDKDKDTVTLIDCPAMPAQKEKRQVLKEKIGQVQPHYRFAVFSCMTRSRDVFEISKMLKELNPTHLILTMQDIASCLGTVVTAARATGLKIAYLSDAPGGMGELRVPDPEVLATKLLNAEVTCD